MFFVPIFMADEEWQINFITNGPGVVAGIAFYWPVFRYKRGTSQFQSSAGALILQKW